ncbi:MAG TPA: aminotransferase class I/II-fold pyridoxal phosphate-dependent enzyme [Blastocatellia bacterium]|nr:aminotransferase class I/II-fold pyridoxal phosphate-dependent enzyme [Blastocatellia bacterium]
MSQAKENPLFQTNDGISYLPPMYEVNHKPGVLKVDPSWAYVPPVRPHFILNLDREETTCLPKISLEEADRKRQNDFPIQQSNRYPSKMIENALAKRIAEDIGVSHRNVLIGNGIMNILTYIYDIYSRLGEYVTVPTPGFWPAYTYALQRARGVYMPIYKHDTTNRLHPEFYFPLEETRKALSKGSTICYLCSPNNPTGTLIPFEYLQTLVEEFPGTLFIWDEAYGPFAANRLDPTLFDLAQAVELIKQGCKNLVVTRTFSKVYALANFRVGYIVSHENNIETVRAHMGPYDMSEMSLAMAYYNYLENDYVKDIVRTVIRNMRVYQKFLEERQIPNYGGYRNSMLVEGLDLGKAYEQNGIAVRAMEYQEGIPNLIGSTFRITIPADDKNFSFLMSVSEKITKVSK